MDWKQEVLRRKDDLLHDLNGLLRIPSVKDLATSEEGKPMGKEIARALEYMLELAAREGFAVKNHEGYVGYAEYGPADTDDYIAVLCHLDVVPATGEWTSPPYEPAIREGNLYARGAIDDKGPTLAAFYALKIVKELGLPLKHKVRLIFGTDEESGSKCMDKYRQMEKMPLAGFAPDADFPIVHAEKGQINTKVIMRQTQLEHTENKLYLTSFFSGGIANMVPESAKAVITGDEEAISALIEEFYAYCSARSRMGFTTTGRQQVTLNLEGKSAHGMEPHLGVNAGLELIHFLRLYPFQPDARRFLSCVDDCLYDDYRGAALGIVQEDEITGPLTINSGIIQYAPRQESFFHLNLRFPVCGDEQEILQKIAAKVGDYQFEVDTPILKKPHHVDRRHPMITALQRIYQEETSLAPTLLSTGGGTYAAHIPNGVAFGAVFPGKECKAHQPDEYIEIEDLLKATAIYTRAIYELANLDM